MKKYLSAGVITRNQRKDTGSLWKSVIDLLSVSNEKKKKLKKEKHMPLFPKKRPFLPKQRQNPTKNDRMRSTKQRGYEQPIMQNLRNKENDGMHSTKQRGYEPIVQNL